MHPPGTIIATKTLIDTGRAFFRHRFKDEQLVSMLKSVIERNRWELPPPLVVQCWRDGQEYYWVLDGHHRIHVCNILSSNSFGSGKLWCYSVKEKDYNDLIKSRFEGVEPGHIGEVREHIYTPIGTANLSDENWRTIQNGFDNAAFIHRAFFLYEKHGRTAINIGHLNLRTDNEGELALRTPDTIETLFPLTLFGRKRGNKQREFSLLIEGPEKKQFEFDATAKIDTSSGGLKIKSKSKGILIADRWLGIEQSADEGTDSLIFPKQTFEAQAIMLLLALRIKGRIPQGTRPRRLRSLVPAQLLEAAKKIEPDTYLTSTFQEVFRSQRSDYSSDET